MRELSDRDVSDFRERIGDAAATLYARGGEAAITMREIARAVDASPMGLYRYFEDRDAIVAYLRTRAFTRFAGQLETAFAKGTDPFARARAVGRAYLDFALENPGDYRLMFDLSQPNEKENSPLAKASARATLTVTRHVDDLKKAGIVVGDSKEIGRALSDGNEPMTPALHCAMTRSGLEMMNSGEPITGIDRGFDNAPGNLRPRFSFGRSATIVMCVSFLRWIELCATACGRRGRQAASSRNRVRGRLCLSANAPPDGARSRHVPRPRARGRSLWNRPRRCRPSSDRRHDA
jgi:AcrR family transcriptional regulator